MGAGRYHTAMCTETELYTVGKNLGQLGYEKTLDTQVLPHAVSLSLGGWTSLWVWLQIVRAVLKGVKDL